MGCFMSRSDFLVVMPGFWGGMARVLALWPRHEPYNYSVSGADADAWAIRNDWRVVSRDVACATYTLAGRGDLDCFLPALSSDAKLRKRLTQAAKRGSLCHNVEKEPVKVAG